MEIRDGVCPPEAAADRTKNSARMWIRSRTAWIGLSCVIAVVSLTMWLRYNLDSLNANERRLIGTWTWKDAPGQTITQFRADRTQRHIVSPTDQRPVVITTGYLPPLLRSESQTGMAERHRSVAPAHADAERCLGEIVSVRGDLGKDAGDGT